jgi:hypothetical protein
MIESLQFLKKTSLAPEKIISPTKIPPESDDELIIDV